MNHKDKKLIVFDLDKTLADSKQPIDSQMSELLQKLLEKKQVSIISGGSFTQFKKQVLGYLKDGRYLASLHLFPTCGSAFYQYQEGDWMNMYMEVLAPKDKDRIMEAFNLMFKRVGFKKPETIFGEFIEDRGTQVTFSAYGSNAPLEFKSLWDPDRSKRLGMISILQEYLPEFEIRTGGTSSIDVTRKGIDKAYGVYQMEKYIKIDRASMLFCGDDLESGGNDYPVIGTGVECVSVSSPEDTKDFIRKIIGEKS